jgi:hypothetical protein
MFPRPTAEPAAARINPILEFQVPLVEAEEVAKLFEFLD